MALTVKFWTFGKRENTTTIPSSSPLQTYNNVLLKDNCSVVNPAIKLNVPINTNVYNWNYCYIQEFSRYYWVADWMWELGVWTAELQVDVLGSFRYEIGQQNLYVLRSYHDSSDQVIYNGNIIDSTYPCTAEQAMYQSSAVNNPFSGLYSGNDGAYIVGVINKYASGVQYYAFAISGFKMFCQKLFKKQLSLLKPRLH